MSNLFPFIYDVSSEVISSIRDSGIKLNTNTPLKKRRELIREEAIQTFNNYNLMDKLDGCDLPEEVLIEAVVSASDIILEGERSQC